jgi:hypothetical protein
MSDLSNVLLAWTAYLFAGAAFFALYWRLTRFKQQQLLSYCLRVVMLAIIITPWYVSDQSSLLAPALIIVLMDGITIGPEAAVRAFVPLFLSIIISVVAVGIALLVRKGQGRKMKNAIK